MYGLLSGLTVIEGAAFIMGPSCGRHLAQIGATVIRFDQIGGGPDSGRWPLGPDARSPYREGLNKGKKSIAIDLTRAEGRELAQRLATAADGLFVTNFPVAGFLSYDRLSPSRADLICLRVMGWADGAPAVDYTINAAVGVPMMTGHADDPRPVNHVLPAWDLLAGAFSAVTHAGGACYPMPGAAARLPADERLAAAPGAGLGAHSDEVLADVLGLASGEIGRLHDAGLVA